MRQFIYFVCICVPNFALGASFDCGKAQTDVETAICKYPYLSNLDSALDAAYTISKDEVDEDVKKKLILDQRKWLKQVRNACADDECLISAYTTRIEEIEVLHPSALKELTCEKMRKYPEKIFSHEQIDLGSGHGSPTAVDYGCPESLSTFPFLQRILAIAEVVRSEDGPDTCIGSIVHAHWRFYHFDLAKAGFAPSVFLKQAEREQNPNAYPATSYPASLYKYQLAYFQQWGEQSIYNFQLYKEFLKEFEGSLPKLSEHYQNKFGLSKARADAVARHALMLIVKQAAGAFPMDILYESPSQIVQIARNPVSTLNEFRNALENDSNVKQETYFLHQALTLALLNNRPGEIIALLISKMPREEIARKDVEFEPLLSFSIGNVANLKLLLASGAPIDAANAFGKTALYYAIGLNAHEEVAILLTNGANVNHSYLNSNELRPDGDECFFPNLKHTKRTPLMHAAQNSDVGMLKLLIKNGAKQNEVDELGSSALDYAIFGKKPENESYLASLGVKKK